MRWRVTQQRLWQPIPGAMQELPSSCIVSSLTHTICVAGTTPCQSSLAQHLGTKPNHVAVQVLTPATCALETRRLCFTSSRWT